MKKRLLAMILSLCLVMMLLPATAMAEETGNTTVNVSSWDTFQEAVKTAGNGVTTTISLQNDIVAQESLTVEYGQIIVLDLGGHSITVSEGFSARIFTNYGDLTIRGNGAIDVSNAGNNGYGTVNNFGTLTVEDGTYTNLKESNASNFYNRNGGVAIFVNPTIYGGGGCVGTESNTTTTIYGGYYEDSTYPAIENRGDMIITGGTFKNTSCSSCDGRWGYTIRSGESASDAYLKIQGEAEDSVQVTGVQGGLAVVGGTADIYNGTYETVACEKHSSGNSAFYAGYFTGESYKTATTIYGGTFCSFSKTAVLVGNGNPAPDSGAGKESTVMIYDGTFKGGDAAKTAITVNEEKYAVGAAKIYGGAFSSDPSDYVKAGNAATQQGDLWVVGIADTAVAKIGAVGYNTLADAVSEAEADAAIQLLTNVTEDVVIPAGKAVTLDLNGYQITNAAQHTITNHGTLTVMDSSPAQTGTVDNVTHGKAAVYNYGTMTTEAGTYTRSLETQDLVDDGADNSWYTVVNAGTMIINHGTFTTADGASANLGNRSSLIRNGDGTAAGTLTITGGTFTSGANVLKNESGSVVEAITGGTFTMDNSAIAWYGGNNLIQSYGTIKAITGGTFKALGDGLCIDGDTTYYRHGIAAYGDGRIENIGGTVTFEMQGTQNRLIRSSGNGSITITGGSYTLASGETANNVCFYKVDDTARITITGGTFSSDPSAYVASSYRVTGDGPYTVSVIPPYTGGGSSSGSSGNKTETEKNPDGSTTTTVTKPDGSTTETTKQPDGSTTTVVTDKNGNEETTVKLPSSVVTEAAEKGEAVSLPMDSVKASGSSNDASPITVDLPSGTSAKVEIPVSNVTAGTVAILVKADGTEQVIKTSVTTENGVALTVEDGATVKIVDNAKDFADVPASYWASDAIDFATSRELFAGTSATTFTPVAPMTRAMIVTVLARYSSDAASSEIGYAEGQQWAVESGISDGSNMSGTVSRQQLATMLYRYADSPVVTGDLSAFPDASSVSDYATAAMAWAVENGLITGMTDGSLNPYGLATRAQVATILMRFVAASN